MIITGKELKNVQVYTQSGLHLGKLHDFEIDSDTGNVVAFHVKSSQGISGLFNDCLVIQKNDVIDFDAKKMIVKDQVGRVLESSEDIPQSVKAPVNPVATKS